MCVETKRGGLTAWGQASSSSCWRTFPGYSTWWHAAQLRPTSSDTFNPSTRRQLQVLSAVHAVRSMFEGRKKKKRKKVRTWRQKSRGGGAGACRRRRRDSSSAADLGGWDLVGAAEVSVKQQKWAAVELLRLVIAIRSRFLCLTDGAFSGNVCSLCELKVDWTFFFVDRLL